VYLQQDNQLDNQDGIIFMATDITDKHLEVIHKINVPVIIVGQTHELNHF
jgi:LacI family sucrose operon transcriptional repressor